MDNQSKFYRNQSSRRDIINHINVTPFVDVMLVLLIIFMVTSPMLVSGINIDLPKANTQPLAGQDEPISITVDRLGNAYINNSHIKQNIVVKKLKAITREKYDTRIFVRGDKMVNYGKVIKVVSLINHAGFSKVSLVTEIE